MILLDARALGVTLAEPLFRNLDLSLGSMRKCGVSG